jgi:hypothetical protein
MPPETSSTATDLEVDAAPVLSYPMAHNRLAVVSRIAVRHRGPAVAGASVQVEVRDVEGRIGTAWERLVDLAPDAETQLTDIDLHLDADSMLRIEAQRPAQVVVRVLGDGVLLAERSLPVELLAARQWVAVPPLLATELLAAFVMPNHPAVAVLAAEASALLADRTGSPVTPPYDEGPERVDATVRALFDAMQARRIRAIEPPSRTGRRSGPPTRSSTAAPARASTRSWSSRLRSSWPVCDRCSGSSRGTPSWATGARRPRSARSRRRTRGMSRRSSTSSTSG